MQRVSPELETLVLEGLFPASGERNYDWTDLVEIYPPDYIPATAAGFDPLHAVERFAELEGIVYNNQPYLCKIKSRDDVNKSIGRELNSVTIRFENVSRYFAGMLNNYPDGLEGFRLVIRTVSEAWLAAGTYQGIVIFSGRIDKPGDCDEEEGTLSAKQDLGSPEASAPPRTYTIQDPLGRTRDNPLYEGFQFVPISGVFTFSSRTGGGIFHRVRSLLRQNPYSSQSGTPIGSPIKEVFGRSQVQAVPLEFADLGWVIAGLYAWTNGRIQGVENLRCISDGFAFAGLYGHHLGDLGGTGTNATPDIGFPQSPYYSRLAYTGLWSSDFGGIPEVRSEPPTYVAMIAGKIVPVPDGAGGWTNAAWTDDPVAHTRFVLTDPEWNGLNPYFIDDTEAIRTRDYCAQVIIDDSQGERVFLPLDLQPDVTAGTIRRLRSTGVIDWRTLSGDYDPWNVDPPYEFFNPSAPPAIIAPTRYYRKRFTSNLQIQEDVKILDLLYSVLLPAFRGFLVVGANGKYQIKCERPADHAYIRGEQPSGINVLPVDNITPWIEDRAGWLLVGYGQINSEIRRVLDYSYTALGNAITLRGEGTGSLTLTASGATFTGGQNSAGTGDHGVQASGFITVGGFASFGSQLVATIDGRAVAITSEGVEHKETLAQLLKTAIDADPVLNQYVGTVYDPGNPYQIELVSKMGFLHLAAPLANAHAAAEEVIRVQHFFAAHNVIPKSFKFPLQGQDKSTNQVALKFFASNNDFAETTLILNDPDHQARIGKKNKQDIDGSAIDSLNQATIIGNSYLAKYRDGNWRATWKTDCQALLLEEGDLCPVTDDSGGFINVCLRIEKLLIHADHSCTITGRIYSTLLFSDQVGAQDIPLPTTLNRIKIAPPVAVNLLLTEAGAFGQGSWKPRIDGVFDFQPFIGGQEARVQILRQGDSSGVWKETGIRVLKGDDDKGRFQVPDVPLGVNQIRIVTYNTSNNLSTETGSPTASINILGRVTLPPDVSGVTVGVIGTQARIAWTPLSKISYPDFLRTDVFNSSFTKIGETAGNSWTLDLPSAAGNVVLYLKHVLVGERLSASFVQATVSNDAFAAPTGLTGGVVGQRIKLTWNPVADPNNRFSHFALYSDAGRTSAVLGGEHVDGTTFDLTPSAPGTYNFYLFPVSKSGIVGNFAFTSVVYTTVPNVGTITKSYDTTRNVAVFTWAAVADPDHRITGYRVTYNGITYFTEQPIFETVATGSSVTIAVLAVDLLGNVSPAAASATLTITAPTSPASATLVENADGISLTLSWTDSTSSDVASWEIEDGSGTVKASGLPVGTKVWTTPVTYGQAAYTFRVYARSKTGQRSLTPTTAALTLPAPAPPASATLVENADGISLSLSWPDSTAADVGTYEIETGLGVLVIDKLTSKVWTTPVTYGQAAYSFRVYARSKAGIRSTTYAPASVTLPAPAAPVSATLILGADGATMFLSWPDSTAADVGTYEVENGLGVLQIDKLTAKVWTTPVVFGTSAYSFRVYARSKAGIRSTSYAPASLTIPAPAAPASATAVWDTTEIKLTWPRSTSSDALEYLVTDGAGVTIGTTPSLILRIPPVWGQAAYSFRVYTRSTSGQLSTSYAPASLTIPAPSDPAGFVLDFDGRNLQATWTPDTDNNFEYATANNGTGILWRGFGAAVREGGLSTASRAFTRYLRKRNPIAGVPSNFVSAAVTITAPAAPTLSIPTVFRYPTAFVLSIAPAGGMREDWILRTVVQIATDAAFTNVLGTYTLDGIARTVPVDGAISTNPTVYVRAWFEDLLGAGTASAGLSYTFTRFNDAFFDPASNFVKLGSTKLPLIAGGGNVSLSVAGVLSWTAAFVVAPVGTAIQPTGAIQIAAGSYSLPINSIIYARQTIGSSSAPVVTVQTAASYTAPDATGGTFDIPLAYRGSGADVQLFDGRYLSQGETVELGTFIRQLSSGDAVIGTAKITSANIKNLTADKIQAAVGDFYIVFANIIASRNYIASGSQAAVAEPASWQNATNGIIQLDGSYKRTGGADNAYDGGAVSSRAALYGDCYAEIVTLAPATMINCNFGLTWTGRTDLLLGSGNTQFEAGWGIGSDGSAYWLSGAGGGLLTTCAAGDKFRVAIEGANLVWRKNGAIVKSLAWASPKYPLTVDCTTYNLNSIVPAPTVYGVLLPTLGSKIRWTNLVNVGFDASDDLSKIAGINQNWGDAGAFGIDSLPAGKDGSLSHVVVANTVNDIQMIGFSTADTNQSYATIGWALYHDRGTIYVFEGGTNPYTSAGSGAIGDLLSVSREGGVIKYRKNGVLIYTSTVSSNGAALYPDLAVFSMPGKTASARLNIAGAKGVGVMIDTPGGSAEFGKNVKIGDYDITEIQARATTAITANLQIAGNDYGIPLPHKVLAAAVYFYEHDTQTGFGQRVKIQLDLTLPKGGADPYANMDSIRRVQVKVLNRFGDIVADFPPIQFWPGGGLTEQLVHALKYAHPTEDATYEIRLENYFDFSKPFWIVRGVFQTTPPTYFRKTDCPTDFAVNQLAQFRTGAAWKPASTNAGTQILQRRKVGDAAWTNDVTGIGAAVDNARTGAGLDALALYEYRIQNQGLAGAYSNIAIGRVRETDGAIQGWDRTGQRITIASGSLDAVTGYPVSPTVFRLFWDWDTFYTTPTGYRVYRDGALLASLGAGVGTYDDNTAVAGASYVYQVYADWVTSTAPAANGSSAASNPVYATMPAAINATDPTNLVGQGISNSRVDLTWNLNGNAAGVTLEWKIDDGTYGAGWTAVGLAAGTTAYTHTFTSVNLSGVKKYAYRVKAGASNYTNIATVSPPWYGG